MLGRGRQRMRRRPFERLLRTMAAQGEFSVVQIGAFTGNTGNDPLFTFLQRHLPGHPRSRVVLVEPISKHFEELQRAYDGMPVTLLQCAVAETPGYRDMLTLGEVDPAAYGFPDWLHQLSSLDADRMGSRWDSYEQDARAAAFYMDHS